MKKLYSIGLLALGLGACKPNITPVGPGAGSIDLSRVASVGNSLTAGYQDNALYRSAQLNSYPAMLARQFSQVPNEGAFTQPTVPGEYGFPQPKLVLAMRTTECNPQSYVATVPFLGAVDTATTSQTVWFKGPFNNTGIPGIRCIDYLSPGYGMVNPFANRFFKDPLHDRPIDAVMALNPTFFTLWIGSNDVLGYATAGGDNPSPLYQISDLTTFTAVYDSVISTLTRNGAKGVVLNIPDITAIPYFTTMPPNALELIEQDANNLNELYNGTNIRFTAGHSYFVIEDQNAPGKMRQIHSDEFVLLTIPKDSITCKGWGTTKPIPANYVLTSDEIGKIRAATANFNNVIAQLAAQHDIPVVDMFTYMHELASGIEYGGTNYNAKYVTGGAFSLDGVHPNSRGYALIANQIILAMNRKYGSTIGLIDANSFPGIKLP